MGVYEFLRPKKNKLIVFLIIAFLANTPFAGYITIATGCSVSLEEFNQNHILPDVCASLTNKFNPVLNPVFSAWGGPSDVPIAITYHGLTGSIYYLLMIINALYWYILSCLVVYIYGLARTKNKIPAKRKKHKAGKKKR